MMTVYIETERLILRDWREADVLPFQQMNANQQVRRFFPSLLSYRRSELDLKKMDDIIKETGVGLFAVDLKETNGWLGFIGLNYVPKNSKYKFTELPFYEIGWRLIPEVWDNGIATEGAQAVLSYAKERGFEHIYALAAEQNEASIRVMKKIGMEQFDFFEYPDLSNYHPLKRHVRYHIQLKDITK